MQPFSHSALRSTGPAAGNQARVPERKAEKNDQMVGMAGGLISKRDKCGVCMPVIQGFKLTNKLSTARTVLVGSLEDREKSLWA